MQDSDEYNELLEESKFGFFYSNLIQKQYSIMQLFIETKTENIHVVGVSSPIKLAIRRGVESQTEDFRGDSPQLERCAQDGATGQPVHPEDPVDAAQDLLGVRCLLLPEQLQIPAIPKFHAFQI